MSIYEQLAAPFPAIEIEWRVGAKNKEKTKGIALAYLTARAAMDRLDKVVGPDKWHDEFREWKSAQLCGVSILTDGGWVTKWDGAADTEVSEGGKLDLDTNIKGGLSASFKRACVKWGIGRYLYSLPNEWVALKDEKYFVTEPKLPVWALPMDRRTQLLADIGAAVKDHAMVESVKVEYRTRVANASAEDLEAILAEINKRPRGQL